MRMKKLFAIVVVLIAVVSMLAGCRSASTDNASDTKKKYVIVTEIAYPPFVFTNANQELVGIDVEIFDAIAKDQGIEYEFNTLSFSASMVAVQSGQADGIICATTITDARKKMFDFSDPYYDSKVAMGVAKGANMKSFEDLRGKKVAVKTGTNAADYAKSLAKDFDFNVVDFEDSAPMYQDVITGNTAACFEDYPVIAYNIQQGMELEISEWAQGGGAQYGFAVAKGRNKELIEMFNAGLANIKEDGTYQKVIDKYLK